MSSTGVVTYTPTTSYVGSDAFTFRVNDGSLYSAPATVSITVNAVNTAPVANAQSVTTDKNTAKVITVTGSDAEGSPLTFAVATGPSHGTLGPMSSTGVVTYTPTTSYVGSDAFTFRVNDGSLYSAPATVSITVTDIGLSHAGIALTFDDRFIDDWYAIRNILQNNNAHATFFVEGFDHLTPAQIDKLKVLQQDGNEIAMHGLNHLDAVEYLKTHSINEYLNAEIIPEINLMKTNGFNPVSFAYPYGHDDPALTLALQAYFVHIRDTSYSYDNEIYYQYGSNQPFISGIGIDEHYQNTLTYIYNGISKAKNEDKIIIFYCHDPVASNPGEYQTSYDKIQNILQYVSANNLKTYTISEIQ
jgi:peptidoglycan/xylan/chitin deacetylase (PgdA/CDA1 family)